MVSRQMLVVIVLVGFVCLSSGAEIRKILEEILEDRPPQPPRFKFPPPPPMPADVCVFGSKVYKSGQRFVDENCTGYCRCRKYGAISCVSLCPPSWTNCGPNEVQVMKRFPADREGRCFCTRPICEESKESMITAK